MKKERIKWLGRREGKCPICGGWCEVEDFIIRVGNIWSPITHTVYYCKRCGVYQI